MDSVNKKDSLTESKIDSLENGDLKEKTYSNEITITYEKERRLYYRVSEAPPFHLSFLFALQQSLVSIPKCLSIVAILADIICARDVESFKAKMFATTVFLAGLTTFCQNTFGVRLPVYQGPVSQYVIALVSLSSLPEWQCPQFPQSTENYTAGENMTLDAIHQDFVDTYVLPKVQVFQGSLALAGFIHMGIGLTGVLGFLMRFIGPLTVVPTLLLIAIRFYTVIVKFCETHWGISAITMFITLTLSLFLDGKKMPLPVWTRKRGFYIIRYPLQQVLAILIAMGIGWTISHILTIYDVLDSSRSSVEFYARTDTRTHSIQSAPWFYVPYPGQFGPPSFKIGIFATFMVPTIVSILDSIADYYACARTVIVPTPPQHAINRGIAVEGLFSFIASFFGASHATTTYGGNIGIVGMTKVASRRVFQFFALQMVFVSIIGKFAAFFVTIPYPVLGGTQIISSGIFIGLILSNLYYVNVRSTRNLSVIGISVLLGLMVPYWSMKNVHVFSTGSKDIDDLLLMLMTNPNLFGGVLACILDNTLPGTLEERGMIAWQGGSDLEADPDQYEEGAEVYDMPSVTRFLQRFSWSKYIPIATTYRK